MRGVDSARSQQAQRAGDITGEVEAFAKTGAGQRFIQEDQAVARGMGKISLDAALLHPTAQLPY